MSQEDDSITFFESNVDRIDTDVEVVEQRLVDNITILLSKEQIVVELINLFKKNKNIQEKINTYLNFLFPSVVTHTYNPLAPVVVFRTLNFQIDSDVDSEDNDAHQDFGSFLETLLNILKSKENYSKTEEKLDKLFTPFVPFNKLSNEDVFDNVDALRLIDGKFDKVYRVVKNDSVFIHGYLNKADYNNSDYEVFNYKQYLQHLQSLNVDAVLGKYKIIEKTDSHFLLYSNNVKTGKVYYDYVDPKNNDFYLYGSTYEGFKYDKTHLKTKNILFLDFPNQETAYSFILPKNPTELYEILRQNVNIYNFQDVNKVLLPYNVSANEICAVTEFVRPDEVINTRIKVPKFKSTSVFSDKFTRNIPSDTFNFDQNDFNDTDYHRYIRLNKSKHKYYYIHQLLLDYIKGFHKTYSSKIDKIVKSVVDKPPNMSLIQDKCNEQRRYKVVKTYDNYNLLLEDNGVDVYYRDVSNKKVVILPNDLALLRSPIGDIVYIRTESRKWVRKATLPFKWCNEEYLTYKDINNGENSLCVYDYYDNVCKSIHNFKISQYENKKKSNTQLINNSSYFFDNYKKIVKQVEENISNYKDLNGIKHTSFKIVIKYEANKEDVDDEDLKDEFKFTFEEQQNYAILIQQANIGEIQQREDSDPLHTFIGNILNFINIKNFDKKEFIKSIVNEAKPSFGEIKKTLDDYAQKTLNAIKNQKIKEKNRKELLDKVNDQILKIQDEQRKKLMSDLYFDAAKKIILKLAIKLISEYPKYIVGNIYPDCVKYLGYSVLKSDTRNIISYLSCLIKATYSGGDAVYKKINDEDIASIVFKELESIMTKNANVRLMIDIGMQKVKTLNKEIKEMHKNEITLFKNNIKPFYDDIIDNESKNKTAVHLSTLYKTFAKSKHLKKTHLNVPTLLNACCHHKISDVFENNIVSSKKDEHKENIYVPSNIYIPLQKPVPKSMLTEAKNITFENSYEIKMVTNTYIINNKERLEEFININKSYFQNNKILQDIVANFDDVDRVYQQVYISFNDFKFFQNHILNNDNWMNDNIVKDIKNILYNFMILHVKRFDNTLKKLNLLNFNNDVVNNIIVLSCILHVIIEKQHNKDGIKSAFQKYFELNSISEEYIKKSIEELREQKKIALIDLYIQDDDEAKQQQMALKKIGYNDWYNIGIDAGDKDKYIDPVAADIMNADIMVNSNNVEEDRNYWIDYQGENPDEDDEDAGNNY